MRKLIAYCGLDCEKCDARIATVTNNDALRKKTADYWSELNGIEITPEMINCMGCRVDGVKTPYCEEYCPIKLCAQQKKVETCGSCPQSDSCEKLGMIISDNNEALKNLKE